jgi:ATP-dependent Lon protease
MKPRKAADPRDGRPVNARDRLRHAAKRVRSDRDEHQIDERLRGRLEVSTPTVLSEQLRIISSELGESSDTLTRRTNTGKES